INSRTVGFVLGPRMNAAGRLETAKHALELLLAEDKKLAMEKSILLDDFNTKRREEQNRIYQEALKQAATYENQSVLVLSNPNWSHGIVGIVASKILETFKKPVVIFQEMGTLSKGSARSYGDFDLSQALLYLEKLLKKGGGHKLAAGLTIDTKNIDKVRKKLNEFYKLKEIDLIKQQLLLSPLADVEAQLSEVTVEVVEMINKLEPFGQGNPTPIIKSENLKVIETKKMGNDNQHLKVLLKDKDGCMMNFVSFSFPDDHIVKVGNLVDVLYVPILNNWRGRKTVEGKILTINIA
ncbi:MAG: DHHA1 domain-containing protein, partial [Candidatus Saccharimonadales bacterium]